MTARLLVALTLAVAGGACASRSPSPIADDGDASDGGGEGGTACLLAAKGAFTFRLHNAGASTLLVDLGCGATSPVSLDTPDGTRPAGPGNVDVCEFSCDQIYAGQATPGGCTDCGGGLQRSIAPGATIDIAWDRRVYVERSVDPACSVKTGMCALAIAVAAASSQRGTVTTCPADQHPTLSCLRPMVTSFDVDTTGAEATVDVGL